MINSVSCPDQCSCPESVRPVGSLAEEARIRGMGVDHPDYEAFSRATMAALAQLAWQRFPHSLVCLDGFITLPDAHGAAWTHLTVVANTSAEKSLVNDAVAYATDRNILDFFGHDTQPVNTTPS